MKPYAPLILVLSAALGSAAAADQPAGADACTACHGANGISVAGGIPHLAAQDARYLGAQLRAYRDGRREHAVMQALAEQLDDGMIDALASHYAAMAGPPDGGARSELMPELLTGDFPFPENYETEFTRYRTTTPGNEVRHFYANDTAVEAAREGRALPDGSYLLVEIFARATDEDGEPLRDADGQPVAGERTGFNVMAREAGWGDVVPELLRNENWLYTTFSADGTVNADTNQAPCLACHVPLDERSYTFSIDALAEVARAGR